MISMKDIAKYCGVSVATVSKALSGQPDIGEATKERIRKAADELGYLTNASARALKTHRTYNIGVLFVDEQNSGLAHEYFSSVLENLKKEAEQQGYDITFMNRRIGSRTISYLQYCRYRGVDGVVIACVNFEDPEVRELVDSDVPVVTIDHVFNGRAAVVADNVHGMETLTGYILGKGHRKIAFIHGERTSVTENRLTGFYRAMEAAGVPVDEDLVIESCYHNSDACYEATKRLLSLQKPIDCILFPDDFSYLGGLRALGEMNVRVPEDISTAGYDGILLAEMITPKLTTLRQDTEKLGRAAASKLIELIEHPKTTLVDRIVVEGHLIEGESVKTLS